MRIAKKNEVINNKKPLIRNQREIKDETEKILCLF